MYANPNPNPTSDTRHPAYTPDTEGALTIRSTPIFARRDARNARDPGPKSSGLACTERNPRGVEAEIRRLELRGVWSLDMGLGRPSREFWANSRLTEHTSCFQVQNSSESSCLVLMEPHRRYAPAKTWMGLEEIATTVECHQIPWCLGWSYWWSY